MKRIPLSQRLRHHRTVKTRPMSTLQVTVCSDRHLLALAEELLVIALLELDAADILSCAKVCRTLRDVIRRTPRVQYKLQLGLAGMIDGPASDVPVVTRLEHLRAYRTTWSHGATPSKTVTLSKGSHQCFFLAGLVVYEDAEGLKIVRPAEHAISGGAAEVVACLQYREHLPDPEFSLNGCAVDHAQDLVIVTQLLLGETPQMFFLSISQKGAFHPLAARSKFEGEAELGLSIEPAEKLDICGDLVAWTLRQTDNTETTVLNWKTGHVIWASGEWHDDNPNFYMCCHFLDPTRIAVVENTRIHVHKVDPSEANGNGSYADGVCTLELPALQGGMYSHGVKSEMQRPSAFAGDAPLFQRDPALTLLAIKFSACRDPTGYNRARCKAFLVLVPVAAILLQADAVRRNGDGETHGSGAVIVPWEEWSSFGARVVELGNEPCYSMQMMGSTCMLSPREGCQDANHKYLLEAHPLVEDAPDPQPDLAEAALQLRQSIEDPERFARPIDSTLPCRIRALDHVPGTNLSYISHDGLLHVQYSFVRRHHDSEPGQLY
ncbi:hypothetical protein BD414DRAFT_522797 [Trametes punicea]|nr:hypothetical protein BD414DRAFT_522797 [Trametes punicea]